MKKIWYGIMVMATFIAECAHKSYIILSDPYLQLQERQREQQQVELQRQQIELQMVLQQQKMEKK